MTRIHRTTVRLLGGALALQAFAREHDLDGLKGHRSVGGMRASIYNAFPEAGVDRLIEVLREFEVMHAPTIIS